MMNSRTLFAALVLIFSLAGCRSATPPVNFYVLAAPPERVVAGDAQGSAPRQGPRVGILPITLPGYLQRPQMIIRQDNSVDVKMEDYDRWGEDLGEGIARVLSVAMTNNMAGIQGVAMPLRTGAPVDLRVQVDVRRFEGRPNGQANLEALWTIQKDRVAVREGRFLSQTSAGSDKTSLVQAQSLLLEQLGAELAAGVMALR